MKRKYFLILNFILSLFFLSGCGGHDPLDIDPKLEVKLTLIDVFDQESTSFVQGEKIKLSMELTNNHDTAVTLNFDTGQKFDFHIESSQGMELWRWSADKGFTQAQTELTIQAGETIAVSDIWDQTLSGGGSIEIGNSTAYGSFLDQSPEAKFDFSIQ